MLSKEGRGSSHYRKERNRATYGKFLKIVGILFTIGGLWNGFSVLANISASGSGAAEVGAGAFGIAISAVFVGLGLLLIGVGELLTTGSPT